MNLHGVNLAHRPLTDQQMRAIVGFLNRRTGWDASNRRVRVTRTRIYGNQEHWGKFYQLSRWDITYYSRFTPKTKWNPDDPRIEWTA